MNKQTPDTLINYFILSLSGGFQDAYTYNLRDHVFANGQTGNVVLLSQNLMTGNFLVGLRYLIPVLAFAAGIMVAELIHLHNKEGRMFHWKQRILLIEIVLLFIVGFLPVSTNILANVLVSFTCALQVQSFRSINGYDGFASTMCIGNIRSGMERLTKYIKTKQSADLSIAVRFFLIILIFALGAGIGGVLSPWLGFKSIWISCALLLVCLFLPEKKRSN